MSPETEKEAEEGLAQLFRGPLEDGLKQGFFEAPVFCRAMLRATFAFAFEHLKHEEAVRVLARSLNELNAEHAKKPPKA
jgi:hypothetical protein